MIATDWKQQFRIYKNSGKIVDILREERIHYGEELASENELKSSQIMSNPDSYNTRNKMKEIETITPDKKGYNESTFPGMESLRSKNRRPGSTFKRREALNKGFSNDPSQMTLDKFLVPKRKSKVENKNFMMMSCSDSFSWMPDRYESSITSSVFPHYRSIKRITKLMGKQQEGPMTRSRLASKEFICDIDEFSNFSSLQDIKKKKRDKLSTLKNNDMLLMSAWDEDSALSVQNHLTRRFRKRKAIPFAHE